MVNPIFTSGNFPRCGNIPNVQFPKRLSQGCPSCSARTPLHPKLVLIVSISPLTYPSRSARPPIAACSVRLRRPNLTYWKLLPGKLFVKKSPPGKTPLGNT